MFWLTRFWFERSLGFIYLLGFLIVVNQFRPLCGERGLLTAPRFIQRIGFRDAPSIFHFGGCNDRGFHIVSWLGVALSCLAASGVSDAHGMALSVATWSLLWILYMSYVNIGQTFYGFGWETLLLECGFLAIFLGPNSSTPPTIVIWFLRWILFRLMFGAGMIKIRADPCWRDLTCMQYHYETQPLPNPLSRAFHHLPVSLHKASVLFNHFVELVVPWFFFFPQPYCAIAGGITVLFQIILILSGNLSWLNYITIVLCISCFDDSILSHLFNLTHPDGTGFSTARWIVLGLLSSLIAVLSIRPARNLFSKSQMMNASFDPLHLVNTYGAFGSITRERMEVIIEGTDDPTITSATRWKEYEFKGKPGDISRRPCMVSPYHYKLDWQMWFAAMSAYVYHPWILNLVSKLLRGDRAILALMSENPFPERPPNFIRAELYLYQFTDRGDRSGNWWKRSRMASYLPPLSLGDSAFQRILRDQGWIDAFPSK